MDLLGSPDPKRHQLAASSRYWRSSIRLESAKKLIQERVYPQFGVLRVRGCPKTRYIDLLNIAALDPSATLQGRIAPSSRQVRLKENVKNEGVHCSQTIYFANFIFLVSERTCRRRRSWPRIAGIQRGTSDPNKSFVRNWLPLRKAGDQAFS